MWSRPSSYVLDNLKALELLQVYSSLPQVLKIPQNGLNIIKSDEAGHGKSILIKTIGSTEAFGRSLTELLRNLKQSDDNKLTQLNNCKCLQPSTRKCLFHVIMNFWCDFLPLGCVSLALHLRALCLTQIVTWSLNELTHNASTFHNTICSISWLLLLSLQLLLLLVLAAVRADASSYCPCWICVSRNRR